MSGQVDRAEQYWMRVMTPPMKAYIKRHRSDGVNVMSRVFENLGFTLAQDLSPANTEVVHPQVASRVRESIAAQDRKLWLPSYPDGWILEYGEPKTNLTLKAALEFKIPSKEFEKKYQKQFIGFTYLAQYLGLNDGENGRKVFGKVLGRPVSRFGVSPEFAYIYVVPAGQSILDLIRPAVTGETIREVEYLWTAAEIRRRMTIK